MKRLVMVISVLTLVACAPALAQQDTSGVTSSASYSASAQEGWLGMGISCSQCTLQSYYRSSGGRGFTYSSGGNRRWTFREPPVVFSVEANGPADKAGLHTGDTLVSIDGYPLTSVEGGERFASVQPQQTVQLRYRRDGRESDARLTAGARPRSAEFAMQDSIRALARAQAQQRAQMERAMERARAAQVRAMEQSQEALERQREYMQRAMEQLQQVEGRLSDSTRQEAVERTRAMLDSAVTRWRIAESLYAQIPTPTPVASAWPTPPVAAVAPGAPVAPLAPGAVWTPMAPVAPLSYREHRAFGPLRYSGQIGDVVIEARSPFAATATEISDSEVVVTSRDLSVRVAVRPRPTPAPRAEAAPKPAPSARPSRTPRPSAAPQPGPRPEN